MSGKLKCASLRQHTGNITEMSNKMQEYPAMHQMLATKDVALLHVIVSFLVQYSRNRSLTSWKVISFPISPKRCCLINQSIYNSVSGFAFSLRGNGNGRSGKNNSTNSTTVHTNRDQRTTLIILWNRIQTITNVRYLRFFVFLCYNRNLLENQGLKIDSRQNFRNNCSCERRQTMDEFTLTRTFNSRQAMRTTQSDATTLQRYNSQKNTDNLN